MLINFRSLVYGSRMWYDRNIHVLYDLWYVNVYMYNARALSIWDEGDEGKYWPDGSVEIMTLTKPWVFMIASL